MDLEYVSKNAIRGGDASHNAYLFKRVLSGDRGPFLDFVALNSAAVLYVGGRVDTLKDGLKLAFEILRNKTALEKAREYVAMSQALT
jgi:anthranilate phosphoribosyltransferase